MRKHNNNNNTQNSPQNYSKHIHNDRSTNCFVRIESVYLLVHHSNTIYRKLLAPEPSSTLTHEHFIKTIRLIEGCEIQFELNFRILPLTAPSEPSEEINLLFHEILQENRKTCSFFLENMGKFKPNSIADSYSYSTTISNCSKSFSQFSLVKNQSIRLEVCDVERTSWFIGEWKVKIYPRSSEEEEIYEWLNRGQSSQAQPAEDSSFSTRLLEIPNRSTLSNSPLSSSPITSSILTGSSRSPNSSLNSPTESIAASFEDLDMSDFAVVEDPDESLSLPRGNNSCFQDRLLFIKHADSLLTDATDSIGTGDGFLNAPPSSSPSRQNSLTPTRSVTPTSLSTVDIFHQVGSLFFGSELGQFVTSSIKKDPNESNIRTAYSTSTIHLLGVKYQLKGLHSNVLLMENDEISLGEGEHGQSHDSSAHRNNDEDEDFEITKIFRFNSFCSFLKRSPSNNCMFLREILLLKRAGPVISARLKDWFESFNWIVEAFSSATLLVSNPKSGTRIEVKVYCMKPSSFSPANTPELFLVELVLMRKNAALSFNAVGENNAYFVELTAFVVQMEISLGRRTPEIVLMETWNSHVEPERIGQSLVIPGVKYSVIPDDGTSNFSRLVYFWSDHLQGWLMQNLSLHGMVLSLHPLIDASLAIQINLSGSHLNISQDHEGKIGNFSLITSRGQMYSFRVVEFRDLKEIIGRIRFAVLSRVNSGDSSGRRKTNSTLLQADKIYRSSVSAASGNPVVSDQELDSIRALNISVLDAFIEDFRSRFWFTYRRGFPRIEPSLFTTDLGWGCMLRTGQCLMAEAMSRFYFGRKWRLWQLEKETDDQVSRNEGEKRIIALMRKFYLKIHKRFIDQVRGDYSVHRLAIEGAKIGTPIGQWFGPSIIGKVLK